MEQLIKNTIESYFKTLRESFEFQSDEDDDDEAYAEEIAESINGYARGYGMMKCAPEEWADYIDAYNIPKSAGKVLKQSLPNFGDKNDRASMHRYYKQAVEEFNDQDYLDDFIRGAVDARKEMRCAADERENKTGMPFIAILEFIKPKLIEYAEKLANTDYTDGTIRLKQPKLTIDGYTYDEDCFIGYCHTEEMQDTPWGDEEFMDDDIEWQRRAQQTISFFVEVNSTWEASYKYGPYAVHNIDPNNCQIVNKILLLSKFSEGEPADKSFKHPGMAYPRMQVLITVGYATDFRDFNNFIHQNDLVWDDDPCEKYGSFDISHYATGGNDGSYKYMDKIYNSVLSLEKALNSKINEYTNAHRQHICAIKVYNDSHDASTVPCPIDFVEGKDFGWDSENGKYEIRFSNAENMQAEKWIKNLLDPIFKGGPYEKLI